MGPIRAAQRWFGRLGAPDKTVKPAGSGRTASGTVSLWPGRARGRRRGPRASWGGAGARGRGSSPRSAAALPAPHFPSVGVASGTAGPPLRTDAPTASRAAPPRDVTPAPRPLRRPCSRRRVNSCAAAGRPPTRGLGAGSEGGPSGAKSGHAGGAVRPPGLCLRPASGPECVSHPLRGLFTAIPPGARPRTFQAGRVRVQLGLSAPRELLEPRAGSAYQAILFKVGVLPPVFQMRTGEAGRV